MSENNTMSNNVNDSSQSGDSGNGIFIMESMTSSIIFLVVLAIVMVLYYVWPLYLLYKNRNWYIVKQRNFILTFVGSIANLICTLANILSFGVQMSCLITLYTSNIITLVMNLCTLSRGFRLIFLYKLNIYKVTQLSQKKFLQNSSKSKSKAIIEPNVYYKTIYRIVTKRIVIWCILLPVLIELAIMTFLQYNTYTRVCEGFGVTNLNSAISDTTYYNNKSYQDKGSFFKDKAFEETDNPYPRIGEYANKDITLLFRLAQFNGICFVVLNLIIAGIFTFTNIKDDQKFGIKFDCYSTSVIGAITEILHIYLKNNENNGEEIDQNSFLYNFKLSTKDGIVFFCLVGMYIQFTSVLIPLYKCYQSKKLEKEYENEPTNSMQYFYKILNSPALVEELKSIAIQEFVVENVLFWENYCTLQSLVYRFRHKKGEFGEGSSGSHGKTYQDVYSQNSGNSHDDESYDPNFPLMPQLVPYFNAFYHTFIDIEGPASVNISGATIRRIYHDFYTYPTVGIFDEAKDEVVESMYLSIFPILLQQNRKQLGEL